MATFNIDLSTTDLLALPIPEGAYASDTYKDTNLEGFELSVDSTGEREFTMYAVVPKGTKSQHKDNGTRPVTSMQYVVGVAGIDTEPVARKCAEILKRMAGEGFLPFHENDFAELEKLRSQDLQDVIRVLQRERKELVDFLSVIDRERQEMREWINKGE